METFRLRSLLTKDSLCFVSDTYPGKAVKTVNGGELKVQTEKVKREDADNVSLPGEK